MDKIYNIREFDIISIVISIIIDILIILLLIYFVTTQFEWFYAVLLPLMIWAFGSNFIKKIKLVNQINLLDYKSINIKYDSKFEILNNINCPLIINHENINNIFIHKYGILGFMNLFRGNGSNIGYHNSITKLGKIIIETNDGNNYQLMISNVESFEQYLRSVNITVNIEIVETL